MERKIKLSLLLTLLFFPYIVNAQMYRRIGDTIFDRSFTYHYDWWSDEWLNDPTHAIHLSFLNPYTDPDTDHPLITRTLQGEYVRYCYTNERIHIVGIASTSFAWKEFGHGIHNHEFADSTRVPEYLLLYDATPDTFELKAKIPWSLEDPYRYIYVGYRSANDLSDCENITDHNYYIPIREYFFEKPIPVTDSFYVGMTLYSNHNFSMYSPEDQANWQGDQNFAYAYAWYGSNYSPHGPCYGIPKQQYKYIRQQYSHLIPNDYNVWQWVQSREFMIILPIIAYDTAPYPLPFQCPQASGLRVSQEDNNCAVLMWNSDNASMWQISYGPAGTAPEDGTIIENLTTIRNLCGLDSATQYVAYVRSVCNHEDSAYYSEWSDSVSIHGPAQQEYIRDALDLYTYLMPNPATNEVQIYSSFFLTEVEIYDIKGQRQKSIAAEGLGVKLDIGDLPSGVYVVVIHTPNGIATKKMVVN